MKNKFAVVIDWPDKIAAENELIKRIEIAVKDTDKQIIIIDNTGAIVDNSYMEAVKSDRIDSHDKKYISESDVDFVIYTHFSSKKFFDGFSYVLLWNPINFYYDWGYNSCVANLLTYHDAISCGSNVVNNHFYRNSIISETKHLYPELILNHTNSNKHIPFHNNKTGIFYCGIGWDVGSGKQRFYNIFKKLDKENIIKIYGPNKSGKKITWKGLRSYRGFIPVDGYSLFNKISESIIALAFSHNAHLECGIATSRIFEIIASGTLPLCDDNPFIKEHFGDMVLYLEGNTDDEKADSIKKSYEWALNNKTKVKEMIEKLQNKMLKNYDLKTQILNIYNAHENRRRIVESKYQNINHNININILYIVSDKDDSFDNLIASIKTQKYQNITLYILSKNSNLNFQKLINNNIKYNLYHKDTFYVGDILAYFFNDNYSQNLEKYFMILNANSRLFYDHISSLIRVIEENIDAKFISTYKYDNEFQLINLDICMPFIFYGFPNLSFLRNVNLDFLSEVFYSYYQKQYFTNRKTYFQCSKEKKNIKNLYSNQNNIIRKSIISDILNRYHLYHNMALKNTIYEKNEVIKMLSIFSIFRFFFKIRSKIHKIKKILKQKKQKGLKIRT